MVDETAARLDMMKREIDALQIEIMKDNAPWYRSASVVISLLALLFSFGTTVASYHRSATEDFRSAQSELRGILLRLVAIPKEKFQFSRTYLTDPDIGDLYALSNQETSLLTRQATEIVDRYPTAFSASEYLSVAIALISVSDQSKVSKYLDRSLAETSDPNVRVASLRNYGRFLMTIGQTEAGRRKYELALGIWHDYSGINTSFRVSSDAQTEILWAQEEFNAHEIEASRLHIGRAAKLVDSLDPGNYAEDLKHQVQDTKKVIDQGMRQKAPGN